MNRKVTIETSFPTLAETAYASIKITEINHLLPGQWKPSSPNNTS